MPPTSWYIISSGIQSHQDFRCKLSFFLSCCSCSRLTLSGISRRQDAQSNYILSDSACCSQRWLRAGARPGVALGNNAWPPCCWLWRWQQPWSLVPSSLQEPLTGCPRRLPFSDGLQCSKAGWLSVLPQHRSRSQLVAVSLCNSMAFPRPAFKRVLLEVS